MNMKSYMWMMLLKSKWAGTLQGVLKATNETKKTFRYMNRIKFEHDDYPIIADLSIIRSSRKNNLY